jgi:hypothetical protein
MGLSWRGIESGFEEFGEPVTGVFDSSFGICVDRSTAGHSTFGVDEGGSNVCSANVGGEGVLGF